MPTGHPKTEAEKHADALMEQILANAKELQKLAAAGATAQAKLERAKSELNGA